MLPCNVYHSPTFSQQGRHVFAGNLAQPIESLCLVLQLKTIKERLEKLAKEREQLLEYQMLDKKRKAIEFCILDHDRVKIVKELNEVCPRHL